MKLWAERGLYVGNTYFSYRSFHKYGVEVKSMIDHLLGKKDILRYLQDVREVTGMGRSLSDHHVILCKIRLIGAWIKRREVVVGAGRNRSEKLMEQRRIC